jgi:hypothetical protein
LYRFCFCNRSGSSCFGEFRKFIIFKVVDDAGSEGYKVYVEDGNLVFATEFPNKVKGATEGFISKNISTVVGKGIDFTSKFTYTSPVRYIYYSEFKKVDSTTGKQDDFATIKACHDYANKWGHTVNADEGKTYYINAAVSDRFLLLMPCYSLVLLVIYCLTGKLLRRR